MMDGKWSDAELDVLREEAANMEEQEGKVTQRGLARRVDQTGRLRFRSHSAIYIQIRKMMSGGRGWWSHVPLGRQIV